MDENSLYRELVTWLREKYPYALAEWERERKRGGGKTGITKPLLQATAGSSGINQLSPGASTSEITQALQEELESLGITGGVPGITLDGTPCIHVTKQGVYGSAYEENVTLARLRDPGYRRHLRQVFG
jgi:hypothetical protein